MLNRRFLLKWGSFSIAKISAGTSTNLRWTGIFVKQGFVEAGFNCKPSWHVEHKPVYGVLWQLFLRFHHCQPQLSSILRRILLPLDASLREVPSVFDPIGFMSADLIGQRSVRFPNCSLSCFTAAARFAGALWFPRMQFCTSTTRLGPHEEKYCSGKKNSAINSRWPNLLFSEQLFLIFWPIFRPAEKYLFFKWLNKIFRNVFLFVFFIVVFSIYNISIYLLYYIYRYLPIIFYYRYILYVCFLLFILKNPSN